LALAGIITAQAVVGGNDERELQSTGIWKYTARGNIVYLKMCWDAQRNMRGLQIKRNGASTKTFGSISGMRCKAHSLAKTDCWIRGSMRRAGSRIQYLRLQAWSRRNYYYFNAKTSYPINVIFGSSKDKNAAIRPYCLIGVQVTYEKQGNYIRSFTPISSRSYQRGLKRYSTYRRTIRSGSSNPVGAIIGVLVCICCYCCVGAVWYLFFRGVAAAINGPQTNVIVVDGGNGGGECVEEVVEEVVVEDGYEGGEK
jgi:hypothetical protein